jgi:hypothetical protein
MSLALVPIAAFVIAFLVGGVALWAIAKKSTFTQTLTKAGKAAHLHTPLGTLSSTPQEQLDPRLAKLPVYSGALREDPGAAQTVTQLDFNRGVLEEVSTSTGLPIPRTLSGNFIGSSSPTGHATLVTPVEKS